jgi:hypothetical protein
LPGHVAFPAKWLGASSAFVCLAHACPLFSNSGVASVASDGDQEQERLATALVAAAETVVAAAGAVGAAAAAAVAAHWEHISLIYFKYISDCLICILLG